MDPHVGQRSWPTTRARKTAGTQAAREHGPACVPAVSLARGRRVAAACGWVSACRRLCEFRELCVARRGRDRSV